MANLMEMLEILKGGDYVHATDYKRITAKQEDDFGLFKANEGETLTKINRVTVSDSKLNVSLLSVIKGKVQINPNQASKVGLETSSIDSVIYRNQALVKNSNVHMNKIEVIVSREILSDLHVQGYGEYIREIITEDDGRLRLKIATDIMPLVDNKEIDLNSLVVQVNRRDELSAKRKVLQGLIRDKEETVFPSYTQEQIELLEEHGINSRGEYVGVGVKKVEKDEENFYIAKDYKFNIKGQVSIPSLNAVLKKVDKGSKLNKMDTIIYDTHLAYKDLDLPIVQDDYREVSSELEQIKNDLFVIRCLGQQGKFSEVSGLDMNGKGDLEYDNGQLVLIIKEENKKVYL